MENLSQGRTESGHFFQNHGTFFQFSEKGREGLIEARQLESTKLSPKINNFSIGSENPPYTSFFRFSLFTDPDVLP